MVKHTKDILSMAKRVMDKPIRINHTPVQAKGEELEQVKIY